MTVWAVLRGPAPRRRAAIEAAVLLPAIRLGQSLVGYARVERRLARWAHRHPAREDAEEGAARVVWAIQAVSRRLPGMACLVQALAAQVMLSRRGVAARVRIGVRPSGDPAAALDAHAWVEDTGGRVVIGAVPGLAEYQPFESTGSRLRHGLAALLRGDRIAWSALRVDPDALLAFCADEDICGLVHVALAQGLAVEWPASVCDRLAGRARSEAALELIRAHEIRRVLAALGAAGVRAVLFKGTALAYSTYPRPALRPRADTDLLISRNDRQTAHDALIGLGYVGPAVSDGELLFRQFELQRRDEHGVIHAFDVHWQISNQERFARMFEDDELWRRGEPIEALGSDARAAGAADALLISCVHPVMHHRDDTRLIWMYDTHLIASAMRASDWTSFVEIARAKSVAAVCLHGLALAREHFETRVPPSVTADLDAAARRPEASAEYLAPGRLWRDEVASNFRALPGWRARARLLREMALPAPSYMRRAYSLDRSVFGWVLLPALYAHRGLKAVYKK